MALVLGVLALQGDVAEHQTMLERAAKELAMPVTIKLVRTKDSLRTLSGLIIPGGESTTLQKLCEREDLFDAIKSIPVLFGTCAGAILLAKHIENAAPDQKTLSLMDITVARNAYGRQAESFDETVDSVFGPTRAVFIRAPKIIKIGERVKVLASRHGAVLACEERTGTHLRIAACFHPELSGTTFHRYFIEQSANA